mmetsp:Transcript_138090/g.385250  ORF Transcript_138090/g.385250 Transcript_138090/m.385250 type:complete len:215 (-) Transcript_138090:860-1504(-)
MEPGGRDMLGFSPLLAPPLLRAVPLLSIARERTGGADGEVARSASKYRDSLQASPSLIGTTRARGRRSVRSAARLPHSALQGAMARERTQTQSCAAACAGASVTGTAPPPACASLGPQAIPKMGCPSPSSGSTPTRVPGSSGPRLRAPAAPHCLASRASLVPTMAVPVSMLPSQWFSRGLSTFTAGNLMRLSGCWTTSPGIRLPVSHKHKRSAK